MTAVLSPPMTDEAFRAEFLGHAALPEPEDVVTVVEEYAKTRQDTIAQALKLGIGPTGVSEIQTKTANIFIKRWMMLKFATVDLSFTSRKWWLKVERDLNNIVKVTEAYTAPVDVGGEAAFVHLSEVDRFFKVEYELQQFAFGERAEKRGTQKGGWFGQSRKHGGFRSTEIQISAVLPDGIGDKHVKLSQLALSHYYLARAMCYARGIDLSSDLGSRWDRNHKILIIWGPNVDVLSATQIAPRPAGDPAIILQLHDQNYLLDFYDTPDETPIVNLIREFSEGKLPRMTT